MKKIYLVITLLALYLGGWSQVLTEDFSYTAGQLITANGWTAHSGAGTNAITVTAPGLTYTGHPGSGVGNAVTMTTSGEDDNRAFTPITTGNTYFSFLVNVSAAQTTGDYFIGLFQTTSIFPLRVYAKADGAGGFFFGVGKGSGTVVYETTARTFGTTYFVVTNYILNTGTTTDDVVNLWVNPALGGTETASTITSNTGTDGASIAAVYLRQGTAASASTQQVDALLVGTTWASVTPGSAATPTLSATALTAFGNVCLNTASAANSFTITGTNLTTANVVVGALTGYTYSTTSGGTYTSTLTIAPVSGAVSQQVFVKLTPTAVQSYNGNIPVSGGGATAINVAATGAGVNTPATITAGAATGITATGATIPGTIPAQGCSTVTAYGAEYSTTTGFANGTGTQVPSTNLSGTAFTAVIASGLTASTTYYYHTFATNAGGTVYSAEQSFTTIAAATPTLTATALTAFGNVCLNTASTANSFTITGANLTTADVVVGALTGYTYSTTSGGTYTSTLNITSTAGAVNQVVYVKLTPTAVQSYSGNIPVSGGGAAAINVAAAGAGVNTPATITAGAATGITTTGATIPGTIPAQGCSTVTAYGAEYSTTTGFANGTGTQVSSTNLSGTAFTAVIASGLTASTTYYYHTFATNAGGTVYSAEQSFTTNASTPTVSGVVISQVYGNGGNTGAAYNADYVELKNITTASITLTGYSIQYGSATVTGTWSGVYALPTFTIPAGGYYLIQMTTAGATGAALPTADATASPTINMSGTAGRVALVNGTTALSACPASTSYVDFVGFGTTTTCYQGSGAAGAQAATTADFRKNNGCTDTKDNANDFEVLAAAPRNSATTAISCAAGTPTLTATALTAFGNVCLNTASTANSFTITGTNLTTANVVVGALTGYTYSTTSGGTYTATLTITPVSGAVSQQVFVKLTPTAVQSYNGNIAVSGGGATAINVAATGAGVNTPATITAGAATGITATGATIPGTIPTQGCSTVTAYGAEYSTTTGFANGTGTQVPSTNLSGTAFTAVIASGLTASTTYYYHTFATNAGGTVYSAEQSFTTIAAATPTLTATALTAFGNVCLNTASTANSFTITGTNLTTTNVVVGALTGYTYSTTSGGTYTATLTITPVSGAVSQQVFVKLTPTAVQSYNGNIPVSGGGATAINVAATGAGVNTPATITAGAATGITTTGATIPGTIPAQGCSTVTAYGAEYSTTTGFANGTGTQVPSTNLSGTVFTAVIASGLTASTTYYYHTFATNAGGTVYSAEQSFTTSSSVPSTGGVVISQVYGGGGNTGATYNADYVELKNISAAPITLTGYSIQYGSATVTGTWSGVYALPTLTIPAGGYYLIQMTAAGTVGVALPTADATASPTINMSGTAGRVALVNGTTALSACPASTSYVDLVGFGTTATCYEGSGPAGAQTSTTADFRKNNGCTEANDNANDFEVLPAAPRNSTTTPISCTGGATPTLTATALTAFGNVCVNTASTANSFTITGTNLTTANVVVGALTGYTYSTTSGGTYTSTLTIAPVSGAVSQQVFVKLTPTAVQSYNGNIAVSGGGATAINVAATGAGINTIASVTSGAASAITSSSATVAGSITATGCSAITTYGIEYSTTNGFANGTGTPVVSTNLSGGNFSSALSGLAASTTYYYHAYATNAGGTAYGTQQSFTTTAAVSPTLSATAPASFGNTCVNTTAGPNSFTISGTLLTATNITVAPLAGYTYSTTSGGTYTTSLTLTQAGGTYSQVVYVKFTPTAVQSYNGNIAVSGGGAPAINVAVTGAGVNSPATIVTGAASAITQTSATLAGTISSTGCTAITAYGVEYSTTAGFANGAGTAVPSTNLSGTGFTSALSGLTVGTTYYYHAYVTDGTGITYGVQQSFTTSAAVLTVGTLTGFGSVCINTTAGPNSFTITSNAVSAVNINVAALAGYTYSTTATGTYTATLSLTHATGAYSQTIYVKFTPTAVQSYNGNIVVSGGGAANTNVAVTGAGTNTGATVTTGAATNITKNSATLAGTFATAGCSPAASYGIEYSSINGLANGLGIKVPSTNLAAGSYTSDITNLVANSTYYYKAYATSSTRTTVYGAQQTFTTGALKSGLVVYNNPVVRNGWLNYSVDNIVPAHYTVHILNSVGQIVFTQGVIVQVNFIDSKFKVPASLPAGTYVLEVRNPAGYVANKRFILL